MFKPPKPKIVGASWVVPLPDFEWTPKGLDGQGVDGPSSDVSQDWSFQYEVRVATEWHELNSTR